MDDMLQHIFFYLNASLLHLGGEILSGQKNVGWQEL